MRLTNLNKTNSPTLTAAETYDRYGNRTEQDITTTGVTTTITPNDNTTNRIANGNGATYDALGNITTENGNTYTYDAENRITSVTGGASATYSYDAFSRRIRKVVGVNNYDYLMTSPGMSLLDSRLAQSNVPRSMPEARTWPPTILRTTRPTSHIRITLAASG